MKGLSAAGLSSPEVANGNTVRDIYDLSGRKTAKAAKGMNIFRMKSGEIRKEIINN